MTVVTKVKTSRTHGLFVQVEKTDQDFGVSPAIVLRFSFPSTLQAVPQLSKDVLCVHTHAVQRPRLAGHRPARRRQPPSRRPQESAVQAAVAQRHRESPGTAPGAVGQPLERGAGKVWVWKCGQSAVTNEFHDDTWVYA